MLDDGGVIVNDIRTRWRALVVCVLPLLFASAVSCGSPEEDSDGGPARGTPEFAVAAGPDGFAMVGADWFEPVDGLEAWEWLHIGALSAGLSSDSAAVIGDGGLALLRPHKPAVVTECADCVGIAVTNEFVVSSRKNYLPDNGIEILLFNHDLEPVRTVPAQRLEERATTAYPAENTDSPATLAADAEGITLGYLARDGGVRRGPSVLAQYDYSGRLLDSVLVQSVLGRSAVSPDGRYLAIGVGGSGGACITVSEPVVVDLASLSVRELEPPTPGATLDAESDPWFLLNDLDWHGGELVATGQVHDPPPGESCDPEPVLWQRRVDAATGELDDFGDQAANATRWVGPSCVDTVTVVGSFDVAALARGSGERLGNYSELGLGRAAPAECDRS